MSRRFLLPNNSVITEQALRNLYSRVRDLIAERDNSDAKSIQEKTLQALDTFFNRLGKPQFEHTEILPDDPLDPDAFNDLLQKIIDDISLGYDEVVNLRESAIATHNYTSMHIAELKSRADEIAGMVTDLRLLSDQQGEEVIVFSDNFNDESKLDPGFPIEHQPAQVMPGQGSLTLARIQVDTANFEDVTIEVEPLGDYERIPSPTNVGRFYEGHFYSFLGEAEPEGGVFHIDERINYASLEEFSQQAFEIPELPKGKGKKARRRRRRLKKDFVVPGGLEEKFLEQVKAGLFNDKFGKGKKGKKKFKKFVQRRRKALHRKDRALRREILYFANNPEAAEAAGVDLDFDDAPLTAENFTLVDKGASEEELQDGRFKMLDGNPASYWQCEVVRDAKVIQDFVERSVEEVQNAEVSADQLRELAQSDAVDREDLEVEIVFTFDTPRTLNWITINPITFDEGAFLEVTDVSTSPDLEGEFEQVDSFSTRQFSNVLTEEANEELPEDLSTFLLAPHRSSYRGQGVWPFAARVVQQVRVRIKQRTPTPNPYEKIVLEAERSHTRRTRRRRRRN